LVGEPFSKPNEVDIAPNIGPVPAAVFREIDAMDGAFPKILRAEETGDTVSDLYEAAATIDRVVFERAGDKGLEC